MTTTVQWDHATVSADLATSLSTVDAELFAGELCLVAGATGSGKSTLLRTVNGSVPHDGAGITGRVRVLGRDTATHPPRRLSDVVGVVPARPTDSFIATTVEEEVGFSVDRLRPGPQARSRRIEERLALFGLAELRTRPLAALSSGQQRRVALAAALAAEPDVLVLDEPTSSLDPAGAAALGQTLQAVARTSGTTVLMSEHRLERLVEYVDSMLYLHGDGAAQYGDPRTVLADAPLAPPIVELSRLLRWDPPAVTVPEAIAAAQTNPLPELEPGSALPEPVLPRNALVARVRGLSLQRGPLHAIRDLDLTIRSGEIVALCGGNGAGKSTLLAALAGLHRPQRGTVEVAGYDPTRLRGNNRVRAVGLVPADPAELLLTDRIDRECAAADDEAGAPGGRTSFLLEALVPGLSPLRDPRTLSAGEQRALALAVVLARGPALILLDEPTRGLDYAARSRLITMLRRLASAGQAVVVATHDVELTAVLASRVVTLNEGRLTGDGGIAAALRQRIVPTQVGAVMAPAPLYTVDDVRRELAG